MIDRGESSSQRTIEAIVMTENPDPGHEPPAETPLEPLGPVEVPEPGIVDVPEPGIVDVPERRL
jgi:hypothetical protein